MMQAQENTHYNDSIFPLFNAKKGLPPSPAIPTAPKTSANPNTTFGFTGKQYNYNEIKDFMKSLKLKKTNMGNNGYHSSSSA